MKYDALIVGNGPAGSVAAQYAAKTCDTLIIGPKTRRMRCAGLISETGMRSLDMGEGDYVQNRLRGARIISPGGVEIRVDGGRTKAYAVDRVEFDRILLEQAQDQGSRYESGWAKPKLDGTVEVEGKRINSEKTILATGTDYTPHIELGLRRPKEYLFGGQYEVDMECESDFVELHFIVSDFFGWVIPLGDTARVGLCVKHNPKKALDRFLKHLKKEGRVRSDKIYSESYGLIPIHDPSMPTTTGSIKLVGDAAGHVKASTGGGVVLGCRAAKHAISDDYDRLWRNEVGFELRLHLHMHRFLNRLGNRGKDRFFQLVSECRDDLERGGDMDSAKKTIDCLIRDPRFLMGFAKASPTILGSLIS
jgi:geranylgeranyl reductase family protein